MKKEIITTTIIMPRELYRKVAIEAIDTGVRKNDVYNEALKYYFENKNKEAKWTF